MKGFSLIEVVVAVGIFTLLASVVTLNLNSAQHQSSLDTVVETLITDLGQQQVKTMSGDTEGRGVTDNYGIHFDSGSYTLFHGTYSSSESTNFSINLPSIMQITTTFSGSQTIFLKGGGEVQNYNSAQDTITVRDSTDGRQKTIELNRYGVVTGVN